MYIPQLTSFSLIAAGGRTNARTHARTPEKIPIDKQCTYYSNTTSFTGYAIENAEWQDRTIATAAKMKTTNSIDDTQIFFG